MSKIPAFGTVLKMGAGDIDPGPETFSPIAFVTNIGGPSLSLDTEDVTTHDSINAWEQIVPTILRTGEISIDIEYDPAEATQSPAAGLLYKLKEKILANFQIIFPDTGATEWDFAAYCTGFEPSAPHDGALTAAVKLKIEGVPILE